MIDLLSALDIKPGGRDRQGAIFAAEPAASSKHVNSSRDKAPSERDDGADKHKAGDDFGAVVSEIHADRKRADRQQDDAAADASMVDAKPSKAVGVRARASNAFQLDAAAADAAAMNGDATDPSQSGDAADALQLTLPFDGDAAEMTAAAQDVDGASGDDFVNAKAQSSLAGVNPMALKYHGGVLKASDATVGSADLAGLKNSAGESAAANLQAVDPSATDLKGAGEQAKPSAVDQSFLTDHRAAAKGVLDAAMQASSGKDSADLAKSAAANATPPVTQIHVASNHVAPAHAAPSQIPTVAPAHVAAQIVAAVKTERSKDSVDVRLDPPELGRVRIEFKMHAHDAVKAVLTAERGETLDHLRRHMSNLVDHLKSAGFSTVDLEFSDRGASAFQHEAEFTSFDQDGAALIQPTEQDVVYLRLSDGSQLNMLA